MWGAEERLVHTDIAHTHTHTQTHPTLHPYSIPCAAPPTITLQRYPRRLFFSSDDCHGTFVEMWLWPVCAYLVVWSIPYSLFMFYCGKGMIERGGYHTMYDDMKDKAIFKGRYNFFKTMHE